MLGGLETQVSKKKLSLFNTPEAFELKYILSGMVGVLSTFMNILDVLCRDTRILPRDVK